MNELLTPRTPGAALRMAREKRRLSIADVVEATRIKPHIIAALESDDYSVIPAPLYGKGFIKLYAEHVGLDPVPLINHYLSNYARTTRPTLKTELPPPSAIHDGLPQPSPLARFKESSGSGLTTAMNSITTAVQELLHSLAGVWSRIQSAARTMSRERSLQEPEEDAEPMPVGRYAAIGFASMVVIILIVSAVYLVTGTKDTAVTPSTPKVQDRTLLPSRSLRLAVPPPAPYIKLK